MMDEAIRQLRGVVMLRGHEYGVPEGMVAVLDREELDMKGHCLIFSLRPDGDRDRINTILQAVAVLEEEFGFARRAEIEARSNIQADDFRRLMERLKRDGNIYEPKDGCYKIV